MFLLLRLSGRLETLSVFGVPSPTVVFILGPIKDDPICEWASVKA